MSDALAATAQCTTTVPPDVSNVAYATGLALPVAFVSLVIAFAVATPVLAAPKAVAEKVSVAAAVPGEVTVEGEIRNFSFPDVLINASTASADALRAAVECVTLMVVAPLVAAGRSAQPFHMSRPPPSRRE
jgi:hypothetical protein